MKNTEELIQKIKKLEGYYFDIFIGIFLSQFVGILFKSPIFIFVAGIISTVVMLLTKEAYSDMQKKISLFVLKSNLFIMPQLMVLALHIKLSRMIDTPIGVLTLMGSLMVCFISISLLLSEKGKAIFEAIQTKPIVNFLGKQEEIEAGDITICINQETNKPVVIPNEDRFVHLLTLGPTGCGKTSQVLIPLIYQDMQNPECGITVLEPKADLAETIYAMAKHQGRDVIYFNPILPDCPYFNPLAGKEDDVIENIATTFRMLTPDSPTFFLDMNENLIRNSLKVLKRTKGDSATLIDLHRLITNAQGYGRALVTEFSRLSGRTSEITKENGDIANWFQSEYFVERSKIYEHCSGLRTQVAKITANSYLRRVLNPPNGKNDLDFDKHLRNGGVLAITTAQGSLRDLGKFLGYFLILNFQASVFRRPGTPKTRRHHFLYIDEFQVYANPGFEEMLTMGRSYRVASHLATQNRGLIGKGKGKEGETFKEVVSTNARNIIIFPGANNEDALYYSKEFGEVKRLQKQKGITVQKFNPFYGLRPMNYPSENTRETEVIEPRFSPSDITYKEFGEVLYRIIKDYSVQTPGLGKVEWIPKELNDELSEIVINFNEEQQSKLDENGELISLDLLKPKQPSTIEVDLEEIEIENSKKNETIEDFPVPESVIEDDIEDLKNEELGAGDDEVPMKKAIAEFAFDEELDDLI